MVCVLIVEDEHLLLKFLLKCLQTKKDKNVRAKLLNQRIAHMIDSVWYSFGFGPSGGPIL